MQTLADTPGTRMKLTIFLAALLAVFLTPSLADDSVSLTNQGNDGGSVHQTVNIDNAKNIANINTNAGWNSWNSIWDYNTGFIALRPFAKKSCYIHRMNKNVVPNIKELARLTKEKKDHKGPAEAPPRSLQYTVTNTKADNLNQYGEPIDALCRGVPSYVAQEVQGDSFFAFGGGGCVRAGLLFILDISVCGGLGF